jgi:hypothetical protein
MEEEAADEDEEVDESVNEAIDWDQAITIKDLINYVVVPFAGASFAAAGAAFGVLGIAKTKQKIKDWFADKKDAADAKQSAKLIKDAIEKIKKDSKAQDMIAQINANPYSKTGSNTERNKLIKPYKAHLKAILSKEQYEVLNDIYSESLKEDLQLDEAVKCPWKFRLWVDGGNGIEKYVPGRGYNKAKGTFNDQDWEDDNGEFENEDQSDLPRAAQKAEPIYMMMSGYGELVIYGNSEAEIQKRLKEYEVVNENFKVDLTNVSNLIESEEGLTEEFKSKAALIFEAEVKSQLHTIREGLKKNYTRRLEEAVATVEESLTEQIDGYLTYAVQQWMKENQVAIESSLRTEIAENFMGSLKTLFTESYVEVPASKLDLFAKLEEEKQEVETKLGRSLELLGGLVEKVEDLSRAKAIEEACADLTQTEALRLKKLAESVEFTNENTFADKVKTLKEFYFTNKSSKNKTTKNLTEETSYSYEDSEIETIVEGQILEKTKLDPEMSQYLKALNAMNKSVTY